MHGLECSSSAFVVSGPNVSLAYELSDRGYDVYIGNARGNTYSRKHRKLMPSDPNFWLFDWHEIALYDLPAMIDFALYKSKAKKLKYFGHSQGGTVFLVLNSLKPEYSAKIESGHLLAPGCFMSNTISPIFKTVAPVLGIPNEYASQTGFNVEPTNKTLEMFGYQTCITESVDPVICNNLLVLFTGYYTGNMNQQFMSAYLENTPNGASIRQFLHFLQVVFSEGFGQFNYGQAQNIQKYGSVSPPQYPLENIKVPTYFYYSNNDLIIVPEDIDRCAAAISGNFMKGKRLVALGTFTHMDFLYANETIIKEYLYNDLFNDL